MISYEQATLGISRGLAITLIGGLTLTGISGSERISGIDPVPTAYLDCEKMPSGASTAVQFDAAVSQELQIGDVQTDDNGQPVRWRTGFDVDTRDVEVGSIAVVVDGFGPIVSYSLIPGIGDKTASPLIEGQNGESIDLRQLADPNVRTMPTIATYTCG